MISLHLDVEKKHELALVGRLARHPAVSVLEPLGDYPEDPGYSSLIVHGELNEIDLLDWLDETGFYKHVAGVAEV